MKTNVFQWEPMESTMKTQVFVGTYEITGNVKCAVGTYGKQYENTSLPLEPLENTMKTQVVIRT